MSLSPTGRPSHQLSWKQEVTSFLLTLFLMNLASQAFACNDTVNINSVPTEEVEHFKTLISFRMKRDIDEDFSNPILCSVTEEEVGGLSEALESAVTALSKEDNKLLSCDSNKTDDTCSHMVCQIKEQASYIVEQIELLKDSNSSSGTGAKYMDMLSAFQKMHSEAMEKNAKLIDNLKREFAQKEAEISQELNRKLQVSQKKVDDLAIKIEKEKVENFEKTKKMVAAEIRSGQHGKAFTEFDKIDNGSMERMLEVLKLAYNSDVNNLPNIIAFIQRHVRFEFEQEVYTSVFEEMRFNNDLNSPLLLVFQYVLHQNENRFRNLKPKLDEQIGEIIKEWAIKIRKGVYDEIKEFAKKHFDSFDFHLVSLIKSAYNSKLVNANKVMSFIETLDSHLHRATGHLALYDEMKGNGDLNNAELVSLACHVKDNSLHLSEGLKFWKINKIVEKLSTSIKELLFQDDSLVVIESRLHPGYSLHCCSVEGYASMYTYKHDDVDEHKWTVMRKFEHGKCYFGFKNKKYGQMLASFNGDHSRVTGAGENSNSDVQYWEVHPVSYGDYVYLKNKGSGRILDANNMGRYALFYLLCCRSEVHVYDSYTGTSYQHWKLY